MADAHFISYSSADAPEFALKLANALIIGPSSFPVWLDKRELRPGDDWDSQTRAATSCSIPIQRSRGSGCSRVEGVNG